MGAPARVRKKRPQPGMSLGPVNSRDMIVSAEPTPINASVRNAFQAGPSAAPLLCQFSHFAGRQFEKLHFSGRQVAIRKPCSPSFWYHRENQLHRLVRGFRSYPKLLFRDSSNEVIRRHLDHLNFGERPHRRRHSSFHLIQSLSGSLVPCGLSYLES